MLLRTDRGGAYRGVDREPFEPLIEDDADMSQVVTGRVSDLYPRGWKHQLYRMAEADSIEDYGFLFSHLDTAIALQRGLMAAAGPYEVVWARILPAVEHATARHDGPSATAFLGDDAAYLGGDFYSAVRNGLFVNPDEDLKARFQSELNSFGLFSWPNMATPYLDAFRRAVITETMSDFYVYALSLIAS